MPVEGLEIVWFDLFGFGRLQDRVDFDVEFLKFSKFWLSHPRRGFSVTVAKLGVLDGVLDGPRLRELFQLRVFSPFLLSS